MAPNAAGNVRTNSTRLGPSEQSASAASSLGPGAFALSCLAAAEGPAAGGRSGGPRCSPQTRKHSCAGLGEYLPLLQSRDRRSRLAPIT